MYKIPVIIGYLKLKSSLTIKTDGISSKNWLIIFLTHLIWAKMSLLIYSSVELLRVLSDSDISKCLEGY